MQKIITQHLNWFAGLVALFISAQALLASAATLAEKSIKVTTSPTSDRVDIQFSDNVTIRVVDGIQTTDYFFIDVYSSAAAFHDKKIPVKDGILKAIETVSYPDLKVLRIIFYPFNKTIFQVADGTTAYVYSAASTSSKEFNSNRRSTRHLIVDTSKYSHYPLPAIIPDASAASAPTSLGPLTSATASRFSTKKRVIIDAGHGGTDPGTQSLLKFNDRVMDEKEVDLAIALELERLLRKLPNVTPILTRENDVYMSKTDRVDFAEKLEGDLFVCIHANATKYHVNDPSLRGVELYYWGWTNSNPSIQKLVDAENMEKEGTLDRASSAQWLTIARQVTKDNIDVWRSFAAEACESVDSSFASDPYYGQFKNRVREAPYRVLANRVMPSFLIEVGYMDIPQEMRRLADPVFQKRIALLLTNGILRYFADQNPQFAYFQYKSK